MRVVDIVKSDDVAGGWWANVHILPPYQHRQRRSSKMSALNFANGFLTRIDGG
jgi:hypothetical protein